jgi:hypothetical protein
LKIHICMTIYIHSCMYKCLYISIHICTFTISRIFIEIILIFAEFILMRMYGYVLAAAITSRVVLFIYVYAFMCMYTYMYVYICV